MDKRERDEAISTLNEISAFLENDSLSASERAELELHAARLSGALLSVWFPVDWPRRLIMLSFFLAGIYGFTTANEIFLYALAVVPVFSPRIVGEIVHAFGRVLGLINGKLFKT